MILCDNSNESTLIKFRLIVCSKIEAKSLDSFFNAKLLAPIALLNWSVASNNDICSIYSSFVKVFFTSFDHFFVKDFSLSSFISC